MLSLIVLALLLLFMFGQHTANKVKDANQIVEKELGDKYNPKAAGNPKIDGTCLVIATMLILFIAISCLGSLANHLP